MVQSAYSYITAFHKINESIHHTSILSMTQHVRVTREGAAIAARGAALLPEGGISYAIGGGGGGGGGGAAVPPKAMLDPGLHTRRSSFVIFLIL